MTDDTLSISQTPPGANCIAPDTPPVGASGAHSSNIGRRRWGKPLTALQIQNAKATGKGYKLPDERGLYLFVTARGTKSWRFRYYVKGEEQSPLPLGLYPAVSAKLARARRDRAIELLAEGKDPRAVMGKDLEVEDGNIGRQFETVAREWWAARKESERWDERYALQVMSQFERDVFPIRVSRGLERDERDSHPLLKLSWPPSSSVARRPPCRAWSLRAARARAQDRGDVLA